MKRIMTIFVLATCLTGWCYSEQVAYTNPVDVDSEQLRQFLLQGYTSANGVLKDIKFIFEQKVTRDPDWLKRLGYKNMKPYYHTYEYIAKDGKERFADLYVGLAAPADDVSSRTELVGKERSINFAVVDGQSRLGYAPIQDDTSQVGRAILKVDHTSLVTTHREISKFFGFEPDLLPDKVLASSEAVIETQPEQISGLLAYKVSAPVEINKEKLELSYWLCPERSCLPVRAELRKTDGSLHKQMEVKDFMQLADGTWVIKEVVHRPFANRDGKLWELGTDEYSIKNIELNPEIDEDKIFSFSSNRLPPGAMVRDLIIGMEYTAGEGPVSSARIKGIIEDALEEIPIGLEPTGNQEVSEETTKPVETVSKPLFAKTGIIQPAIAEQTANKKGKISISGRTIVAFGLVVILVIAGFWKLSKRRSKEMFSILIIIAGVTFGARPARADIELESWQSCCGAVCLQTVAGLLGTETELAEVRELVKPNSRGETSLAQIAETAQKMGFYATGLRVRGKKLQELSVPVIAHIPPNHFVVLLGLGKGKGATIIDPPKKMRKMTDKELDEQEYWNIVAISKHPVSVDGIAQSKESRGNGTSWQKQNTAFTYGPLRFSETRWYFGDINPGIKMEHKFSFKNTGKKKVTLSRVKANCPCVKVKGFTETIEPGQEGIVEVVFDSTGMLGYITKQVFGTIQNGDTKKDEVFFLKVTGEVSRRGKLVLKPGLLYLPDMAKGSTVSKTVTLKRIGYDHLYLKDIKPDTPAISAKVHKGSAPDAYEAQIQLNIKAEDKIGPFEHYIVFETDFPDHPTVTLPVFGNIVSHIKVEPAQVFLGLLLSQGSLEKTIILKSRTDTPFEIKTVKSSVDNITAKAIPANETRSIWEITLTSTRITQRGVLNGEIFAEIGDLDTPSIQIPFTGLVAAQKSLE